MLRRPPPRIFRQPKLQYHAPIDRDEARGEDQQGECGKLTIADQASQRPYQGELDEDADDACGGQHIADFGRPERRAVPVKARVENERELRREQAEGQIEDGEDRKQTRHAVDKSEIAKLRQQLARGHRFGRTGVQPSTLPVTGQERDARRDAGE